MAPKAKIFLVEAASNSFTDLLVAEDCASKLVAAAGGGEISNSWGGSEFSGETANDSHFMKTGIVYFASTGDRAGTEYPSVSTSVVAVGGTTTSRVNGGTKFARTNHAQATRASCRARLIALCPTSPPMPTPTQGSGFMTTMPPLAVAGIYSAAPVLGRLAGLAS